MIGSVAVVGLRHGLRHLRGFLDAGVARVYAVDVDLGRLRSVRASLPDPRLTWVPDLRELPAAPQAYVLSIPPHGRREILEACWREGPDRVWVEKPVGCLHDREEPVDGVDLAGTEVILELRRSLDATGMGPALAGADRLDLSWQRPAPATGWHFRPCSGGVVGDLASHLVDLLSYGTGTDPTRWRLTGLDAQSDGGTVISMLARIELSDGVEARLEVWWGAVRNPEIRIAGGVGAGFELRGDPGRHRDLRSSGADSGLPYEEARNWYPAAVCGAGTGFPTVADALPGHRFTQALAVAARRACGLPDEVPE